MTMDRSERVRQLGAVLLATLASAPAAVNAQADVPGTLVVAHGGGEDWNSRVETVVREVDTGGPVEISFLMGPAAAQTRFQDAAQRLVDAGATHIVVVPVLVSSHSGHYEQIRYLAGEVDTLSETMTHHLHMAGIERPSVPATIRLTRALDDSPEVARVIADRAIALAGEPEGRALFIVGHGPNSAENAAEWMKNLRPIADSVRALTGFRSVLVGLVRDDAPALVRAEAVKQVREMIALQHELTGSDVIVVPVLISKGSVSRDKLPADLAGLPVVYQGDGLLPHEAMARWIESRVLAD